MQEFLFNEKCLQTRVTKCREVSPRAIVVDQNVTRKQFASCKRIRFQSRKYLVVESEILFFGILNPGFGTRNPGKQIFWNPESTEMDLESST